MTRLKLRDDAYYAATGEGVCILTNSGEVELTGPSIYQWVDRLAPYLDGRHTLAELTASMSMERTQMVERVINTLREQGVVVEADEPGSPAEDGFRATPIVLIGAGRLLVATAEAARCAGSQRLRLALDPADENRLAGVVDGAGFVIYVSDRVTAERAGALDRVCRRAGVPFAVAMLTGDAAWLGPFGEHAGWLSAWRRLAWHGAAAEPADRCAGPALTVVANQLMREVVRRLSGAADASDPARLTRVELPGLSSHRHAFVPHPFALAPPPDPTPATIGELRAGQRIDAEEFSRSVTACLDARVGVLGDVTEGDFLQIPLAISQVRVSDPVRLLGPGPPPPVVTGADVSLVDARRAAVLAGLAAYGSLMVDPRRLHLRPGAADPRTGDPETDLAALRAGEWTGFAWGVGLADGRAHAVPAAEVFPALIGLDAPYMPPAGAAAGYDWDEAVRTGLLGRCRQLTLTEVVEGRLSGTPVDWDEVTLDERGHRYRRLVRVIGGQLEVHDITGSIRVPTLAFSHDGVTLAYSSGFSFPEALRDGLAQVVLWHQARADGEARYAPAAVPPLPPSGRGCVAGPTWSTNAATTATHLARLGWTAVAVPLDHDPGVTASIMPYLVHTVLIRG